MTNAEKVRENRLRRMAKRQGMTLKKNPRRDPRAIDYGGYKLTNSRGRSVLGVTVRGWAVAIDKVEAYLQGYRQALNEVETSPQRKEN